MILKSVPSLCYSVITLPEFERKYASEFLSRVTKVGIYNVALLQPALEFYEHRQ